VWVTNWCFSMGEGGREGGELVLAAFLFIVLVLVSHPFLCVNITRYKLITIV
jgi:hypothetical protein